MPQKFAAHPVLGMVLQFTLSLGSTLLICELLVRRRDLKFWLTSAGSRRRRKRPAYAAPAPKRLSVILRQNTDFCRGTPSAEVK